MLDSDTKVGQDKAGVNHAVKIGRMTRTTTL